MNGLSIIGDTGQKNSGNNPLQALGELLLTPSILTLEPESSSREVMGAGVGISRELESSSWEVMGAGVAVSS